MMLRKIWIVLIPLAILGVLFLLALPVAAEPQPQVVYQTPTARPDGRVVYVVQDGDSCLRIQLLTGTTIDTLRSLNKLDQNCTITPNQELLLLVVTPVASATPNPNITATPLLPTPTQKKGSGQICVLLYDDLNGDAVRETSEFSLAGGAASISDRAGLVSKTVNTSESFDPLCEEVPEGSYTISMAIPNGYNPTIEMTSQIQVKAGEQAILEFGAQKSTIGEVVEPPQQESNMMLAVMGGLLVLMGIGLGGYILFTRSRSS